MSNVEDHISELDRKANKKQPESNQSDEVVCITYQTVVHFKHQKLNKSRQLIRSHNYEQLGASLRRTRLQCKQKIT